jgi:hypothetical protein
MAFICWLIITYLIGYISKISSLSVLGLERVSYKNFGGAVSLSFTDTNPSYLITGIYFYWITILSPLLALPIAYDAGSLKSLVHIVSILAVISYLMSVHLESLNSISNKLPSVLLWVCLILMSILLIMNAFELLKVILNDSSVLWSRDGFTNHNSEGFLSYSLVVLAQVIVLITIQKLKLLSRSFSIRRLAVIFIIISIIECVMLPINFGKLLVPLTYPKVNVSMKTEDKMSEKPIEPTGEYLLGKDDKEIYLYELDGQVVTIIKQDDVSNIKIVGYDDLRIVIEESKRKR